MIPYNYNNFMGNFYFARFPDVRIFSTWEFISVQKSGFLFFFNSQGHDLLPLTRRAPPSHPILSARPESGSQSLPAAGS